VVTDELGGRFMALAHPHDDSDWLEVRRLARSRRGRRRFLLAAAAVAASAALAAPAFGLRGALVSWFESEPAPPQVQQSFESLEDGASRGFAPGVVAAETRKVVLPTDVDLWIAPTKAGGFCVWVAGGGGSCNAHRTLDFWPMFSIGGDVYPNGAIKGGPVLIAGSTTLDSAASLEIRFEDGQAATVPVLWISKPIDAGFYGYEVPRANWVRGHRPNELILRDANGKELRRDSSAFAAPWFRRGPSDGLAECMFRLGGRACLEAALGDDGPSITRDDPSRPFGWGGK
jgi:hypothetical protein